MKKITVFLLFAIMVIAITASSAQAESKPRRGIQQNLPVYKQMGVITANDEGIIMNTITEGPIDSVFIPAGTIGDNHWVDESGRYHVLRNYVVPAPGRHARKIGRFIFFQTCDNLFIVPCRLEPDQPIPNRPPPPSPPQKVDVNVAPIKVETTNRSDVNVTVAPIKIEPLKVDSDVHVKLDPIKLDPITVNVNIKDERPPAPPPNVNVTINNIQPVAAKAYYGLGGVQSCHTTTTYQVGGMQQTQLYPQGGNVTATATNSNTITATGGQGGNASATGGNANATGGDAAASAAAAANVTPPPPK